MTPSEPHVPPDSRDRGEPVDPLDPAGPAAIDVLDPDLSGVGRGVRWAAVGTIAIRVGNFSLGIVAARLIAPAYFGAFAVALTVYNVLLTLSDLGVSQAIVREVERTAVIGRTVQAINLGTAALLTVATVLAAPWIAGGLGAPDATPALRVLGVAIFVSALGSVPAAVLTRDYRQQQRFYSDATNLVVSSVTLVVLAVHDYGALALAISQLAGQVASAVVLNSIVGERYVPGVDRAEFGRLLRFSLPLALASTLTIAVNNVDTVTIARLLGADDLGWYNLAFNVANWPIGVFSQILMSITMTTLARVREDRRLLETHLGSALTVVSAAAFPTSALLIALSGPLVESVYGPRWLPAARVLSVLGLLAAFRIVQALQADLLVALGLTQRLFTIHVAWLLALIPTTYLAVRAMGGIGAAVAHLTVAALVVLPLYAHFVRQAAGIRAVAIGRAVVVPALGALVAGLVAWAVGGRIDNSWLALLGGGLAGAAAYLMCVGVWLRRRFLELKALYV